MLYPILIGGGALIFGLIAGYFARKKVAQTEADSLEAKMQHLIDDAKNKEKEILIKAKDQALKIIDEAKVEETSRRHELRGQQQRLESRETLFDQ
ncbi:MAG: Rnase Y domain-containing protein, partial [Patescibacteria group bacterium]